MPWTTQQIIALAPDASSAKSGKELATPRKWVTLGCNEQAAWGECQGSGKEPYQAQIDLSVPSFKCSCPSRKFPCKHTLGLFLLLANQPAAFTQKEPPAWASEWLAKRAQKAEQAAKAKEAPPAATVPDLAAQEKRAARREERVRQGLEEFKLWLSDLVRQGLSNAEGQPRSFWETPAARLVDAQAPGMARRVREMADAADGRDGWQGRVLEHAARLNLLIAGYARIEQLPVDLQAELRTQIGWTLDQDDLLRQAGQRERWLVLGKHIEEDVSRTPSIKTQRTWLWGLESHKAALLLSFAAPGQVLDTRLAPGTSLEAELVFFPGAFPLRALIKEPRGTPAPHVELPGYADLNEAENAYASALAANPWLDLLPLVLNAVTPALIEKRWGVYDPAGRFMPLTRASDLGWKLVALSGGQPLALCGEWDGKALWPMSACVAGRWIILQTGLAEG